MHTLTSRVRARLLSTSLLLLLFFAGSVSAQPSERQVEMLDASGEHEVTATIRSTSSMPPELLEILIERLQVHRLDPGQREPSEVFFWTEAERSPQLDDEQAQMTISIDPADPNLSEKDFIWFWPDGFQILRPGVLQVAHDYLKAFTGNVDEESEISTVDLGLSIDPDVGDLGRVTIDPDLVDPGTVLLRPDLGVLRQPMTVIKRITGEIDCRSTDGGSSTVLNKMRLLTVEVGGVTTTTDLSGKFEIKGEWHQPIQEVLLRYEGLVPTSPTTGTRLQIMGDLHQSWTDTIQIGASQGAMTGDTLDLKTMAVATENCDLWDLAFDTVAHYHGTVLGPTPSGSFRLKRWSNIHFGTPYAFFDYVVLATNYVASRPSRSLRRRTITHEFGHTIRHTADGDVFHWNSDNFWWVYARSHNGTEVTNQAYAFNEGWANYWRGVVTASSVTPLSAPGAAYLDWNERHVGARLLALSSASGAGPALMDRVLRTNPGRIHSLFEFEQRYCALVGSNTFCNSGSPLRARPAPCPVNYFDDGVTCRLDNIRAKPSRGRGVGLLPKDCGAGREYDAGLCYPVCRTGFFGVGPVCWQDCPSGYHDDGATCRRDVHIFASDNSACPWWDICGLVGARGCSSCPPGFHNDGCTCRRDVHIFGKQSFGRGVGQIPTSCLSGMDYDAGLCYPPCPSGFTGIGPVCWGTCPNGYADHGATCYRAPNIIKKH